MARWRRKHDLPGAFMTVPAVERPSSLAQLIDLCSQPRPPDRRLHAAGSHWALSTAAISDHTFIETNDPQGDSQPALARTLFEVIPGCINPDVITWMSRQGVPSFETNEGDETPYYVHVESGKRIYQLYAELDQNAEDQEFGLARRVFDDFGTEKYFGPWAFPTLGSAGGQTVFGALTTGTHGGDFKLPPIADAVAAVHLVADGGKHYWIEPIVQPESSLQLTDDDLLMNTYGNVGDFQIERNDQLFRSVLVSAGRFGVVYSVVLRAVRQYMLHERRELHDWQDMKKLIADRTSSLYTQPSNNRFLQLVVCLTSYANSSRNLCGKTQRWNTFFDPSVGPLGRQERVGAIIDTATEERPWLLFENAGTSHGYGHKHPGQPSFLERACADGDFMIGLLEAVCEELQKFVDEHKVEIGSALGAVAVVAGAGALLALLAAIAVILLVLLAIVAAMRAAGSGHRLGQVLDDLRSSLLDRPDPVERQAGLLAWQMIAYKLFTSQQEPDSFDAISYAVMDTHDYRDLSCNVNVDSIEVFFRADDPMLTVFIDSLIAFELRQELQGKACIGYASLRFTGPTHAFLGPSQWQRTCAVEISALKDTSGGTDLIDFAIMLSRNRNFAGILHWGQRNESNVGDIEFRFGSNLQRWRQALAPITNDGQLDGFSSAFTRQTGLEAS
jgi:hypothetical protein